MTAFREHKFQSKPHLNYSPYCHNLHPGPKTGPNRTAPYKKIATHTLLIIGYPTPLCTSCLKAWREAWESALPQEEESSTE